MNDVLLQLKNVSVYFGSICALKNIDLNIDEGEIVAIMGPNGAGKSTVLKALFGLAPLSEGNVRWHDQNLVPTPYDSVQRGIAFVPQGKRVFPSLSVAENLEIGGLVAGAKRFIQERMREVMDIFPVLSHKQNIAAGTLSGGERQMLSLARGLMTDPKVLLLDEPSLGLSPKIIKEVFAKIHEICERHKTTMVIVEHNIHTLLDIANRAYVFDKGEIVFTGTAEKLRNSTVLEDVFLGKI